MKALGLLILLSLQVQAWSQGICVSVVGASRGNILINQLGDTLLRGSFRPENIKNGVISFRQDDTGGWRYYDIHRQQIIPGSFKYNIPFNNGYAVVFNEGKWGMIDKTGSYFLPAKYKIASSVDDSGLIILIDSLDRLSIVDTTGTVILPFKYKWYGHLTNDDHEPSRAPRFSDDLIAVIDTSIQLTGLPKGGLIFIDRKGNARLGPYIQQYSFIAYPEGRGVYDYKENCKCNRFTHGFALINTDQNFITINKNGDTILQGFSEPIEEEFFFRRNTKGYYQGYSYYSDRTVGCEELIYIHLFGRKIHVGTRKCRNRYSDSVYIHNRYGRHIFTSPWPLRVNNGMAIYAICTRRRKAAFDGENNCVRYLNLVIDTAGKVIFRKHTRRGAITFNGDKIQVKQGKKAYYIDRHGQKTRKAPYILPYTPVSDKLKKAGVQWVGKFHCGLASFQMNYKYGYINEKEEIVVPAIYESAGEFMSIE